MHPLRATPPCQQHGAASHSSRRQQLAVKAGSQSGGQISRRFPNNPLQLLQPQHQQQQQQPLTAAPDTHTSTAVAASLKFAKHLSSVSNGVAPPSSRMESLGWLLFETKRLQASSLPQQDSSDPAVWLRSADSLQLLEQIYLVGAAIAELGTADGLQPLSVSNGARAIVSLDYSRLLERYLQQHGQVLTEQFWCGLAAHDDLQARAIHVATALETRCMVHAMLFDKLIERVGTEGGLITAGPSWSSSSSSMGGGWSAQGGGGPLATAITNNLINTTQQHSAPVTTQSTVAAPSAVTSNSGNNSNTATAATATSSTPGAAGSSGLGHSILGWVGQVGAIFLLLCTVAGKLVHVVIAVVSFGKDLVMQLLMLRAVSVGAKAVAAKATAGAAGRGGKLQPAFAGAAAGGALPSPVQQQQQQLLPAGGVGVAGVGSSAALQPVAATSWQQPLPAAAPAAAASTPAAFSTGSLGLLGAVPLQQQQQQQQHMQPAAAVSPQQQQQQQWRLEPAVVQPTAAWPGSTPAAAELSRAQQQHQAPSTVPAAAAAAAAAYWRKTPRQLLSQQQHVLRSGLASGLGSAQQLLRRAAAKVGEKAAALPDILQQQHYSGSKAFKGLRTAVVGGCSNSSNNNLLYSLWSPSDAGLQDLQAAAAAFEGPAGAAAGVPFADAGWGLAAAASAGDAGVAGGGSANGSMGVVGRSAEEGGW